MQSELERATRSMFSPDEIVELLRRFRDTGITRDEVYSYLTKLYLTAPNEEVRDRVAVDRQPIGGVVVPEALERQIAL